jgi:hypothetical protein
VYVNPKKISVETIPGREGIKERGGCKLKCDIFDKL